MDNRLRRRDYYLPSYLSKRRVPYYHHQHMFMLFDMIEGKWGTNYTPTSGNFLWVRCSKEYEERCRIAFNKWMSARKKFKKKRKWKCK